MEEQIEISTPDGSIDAWLIRPQESGHWPAVIMHTDIKGVRPVYREAAQRLASLGYVVLLPNLYYRSARAPVVDPAKPTRDPAVRPVLDALKAGITLEGLQRDHRALLDWLAAQPCADTRRVAVIGYCMSGSIALHAAADFPEQVVAAASFHGGRLATDAPDSPHLGAAKMRARLYMGYAKDDASMTDEMIDKLEHALRAAGVEFSSERYDALHGFAVKDSPAYDERAEQQHWQAIESLLAATLSHA